jgi:hypothetical protein
MPSTARRQPKDTTMNRFANALAPVASAVASAVASVSVSVALLAASPAQAQSTTPVQTEFARAVYLNSAARVHNDAPQALLRAVVVLRIKLNEQNQWQAEVFRDNPDEPEMTRAALESVANLPAPVGLDAQARQSLRDSGLVEAWLFQSDGRFALKSLAKPQRRS